MFKIKKNKLMYTINTFNDLVDDIIFNKKPLQQSYTNAYRNFDVTLQKDGKQQVTIPVTGHNPKNIEVDVNDSEIAIKSHRQEGDSRYVKDIDLTLTVGDDYDGTKTDAKFENGLLTLLIDKRTDKKSKSIKISY